MQRHLVATDPHHCRFGDTWQPVCLDCDYRGPLVSQKRAKAIGDEHRRKSTGTWKAAR